MAIKLYKGNCTCNADKDQLPAMEKGGWSRIALVVQKPKAPEVTAKAKAETPEAEAKVEPGVPAVREEADAASVQVEAEPKPKRRRPATKRRG